MNYSWLTYEIKPNGQAWCRFVETPQNSGYFGYDFFQELGVFLDIIKHQKIYCLVFRSASGKSFSKGFGLSQMQDLWNHPQPQILLNVMMDVLAKLEALPFPTISVIDGACIGAGLELALHTTYRFAKEQSQSVFQFPELNIGLFPLLGSAHWFYAKNIHFYYPSLLALRDQVSVRKAYVMGLIDDYFLPSQFEDLLQQALQKIVYSGHFSSSRPKRQGVNLASSLLRQQESLPLADYNALWTELRKNNIANYSEKHLKLTANRLGQERTQQQFSLIYRINSYMSSISSGKILDRLKNSHLVVAMIGVSESFIPLAVKLLQAGHFVFFYETKDSPCLDVKTAISNYFQHEVRDRQAFYRLSVSSIPTDLSHISACFCLRSCWLDTKETLSSCSCPVAIYEDTLDAYSCPNNVISLQIIPKWILYPFVLYKLNTEFSVKNRRFWLDIFLSLEVIPIELPESTLFTHDSSELEKLLLIQDFR